MISKQFDLIVWDWDGTIADSTSMITNALVLAAKQVGLSALAPEDASNIIGLGLKESITVLYGEITPFQAQALAAQYTANYYAGESEIPLFNEAKETIIELNRLGFKLAVATGKSRRGLNLALAHSGLTHFFHATRTVDECLSKPHPQMLDELMDDLIVLPERTLMIGDTSYDMEMAQNAGVSCAAVTFGAQSRGKLVGYNPLRIFDQFADLNHWLLALN